MKNRGMTRGNAVMPRLLYIPLSEPRFESGELIGETLRELVAELGVKLMDALALGLPELGIDGEKIGERFLRHAAALEIDILGVRLIAERGFARVHLAEGAAQHPLDHAQVVAEARPEEMSLVVGAEPVDELSALLL